MSDIGETSSPWRFSFSVPLLCMSMSGKNATGETSALINLVLSLCDILSSIRIAFCHVMAFVCMRYID